MESLIIAYDKNMHWIYPDLNSVLSKKFHFLWNGPTEKLETNIKSELHEGTKWIHKTKQKHVLQKYFTKKNSRCYDSNLHLWQSLDNSSHAFTMLLSSELCNTLVIQRDFYTSIIVIVAFDAGIEAGSITISTLYRVARKTIHHCKEMNLYKTIHMTPL